MLMWWAVFFVCGQIASTNVTLYLSVVLLLLFAAGRRWGAIDARRTTLFLLCASTSILVSGASPRPGPWNRDGMLTGEAPVHVLETRERILGSIEDPHLDERGTALIAALLFGSRDQLDGTLREAYAYLGISHFLALSGLHLGILSIPLAWAVGSLPFGRRARMLCLLSLLVCYTLIAGMPPSLVRATALAAAFMFHRSIGRKTTLQRSLSLAVLLLVIMDDGILWSVGFQLSCAAVAAIALVGLPLIRIIRSQIAGSRATRIMTVIVSPVLITISVNIFTLPLQLRYFGRVPLLAPLYNLLMIVPVTLLLYLGLAYTALPFGTARAILSPPIDLISNMLWNLPIRLSSGPQPGILSGGVCVPIYLAGTVLLALSLGKRRRRRALITCSAVLFLALSFLGGRSHGNRKEGTQAGIVELSRSSLLLSGELLIIEDDIGRWEAELLVRNLWRNGVGEVATLLLCPGSFWRMESLAYILSRVGIERLLCSPYLSTPALIEMLEDRNIELVRADRRIVIDTGRTKVRLSAPRYPPPEGEPLPAADAGIRYELMPAGEGEQFEN